MSDLGDLIKGAGDAHADALESRKHEAGGSPGGASASSTVDESTARVVASIRRRRLLRAGATGAVAAIGVGALAVTAMAALGPDEQQPVAPTVTGSQPWCDLDSYPLPNVDALAFPDQYYGRVYADFSTDTYMLRSTDGDLRQLVLNQDNVWSDPVTGLEYEDLWYYHPNMLPADVEVDRLVFDRYYGGETPVVDPTELWFEWGPMSGGSDDAEISYAMLVSAQDAMIRGEGGSVSADLAGGDAVLQRVLTLADGSEQATRLLLGTALPTVEVASDLVALTTAVRTADGGQASVTSEYDASLTYEAACGESDSVWAAAVMPEADSSPDDVVPVGEDSVGYLEGFESTVFSCLAPLDPSLESEPEWSERREGVLYDEDASQQVDYGEGATVVGTGLTQEPMDGFEAIGDTDSPGWSSTSYEDETTGIYVYATVAWVDGEDRIVGTLDRSELTYRGDPWFSEGQRVESSSAFYGTQYYTLLDDAQQHVSLCQDTGDVDASSLTPVLLTGHGPSAKSMDWAWYRFES